MSDDTTITIDSDIYEALSERAEEKGFETTDEYVDYVLGQVADKIERKREDEASDNDFSEKDEEKVKKRLRNLGYLD